MWFEETGHPKTFTEKDFAAIMSSGKLFGRKFDYEVSKRLFDLIDEAVDNSTLKPNNLFLPVHRQHLYVLRRK